MYNVFTVAFFGHRYIDGNPNRIEKLLENQIQTLINKYEYVDFIVGRNGDFDQYAASAVVRTQKHYRDDNSALILVLPYPTAEFLNNEEYFHNYYTDVEISCNSSKVYPKAAIQIRNQEMVDRADLIICYIERNKGGAWQTIQYAEKQGKNIINLASDTHTDTCNL